MHVEISVAVNFVISYLYNRLPRRRVSLLGAELEKSLKKKFEGHWYPDKPFKGSGFRCVPVTGEKIDPVVLIATRAVGVGLEEFNNTLPKELTLWIDPNEVSYRIGEKGQIKLLYSDRATEDEANDSVDNEVQVTTRGFNPEAQSFSPDGQSFKPIDGLVAPLDNTESISASIASADVNSASLGTTDGLSAFLGSTDGLSASLGNLSLTPSTGGLSPSSPVSSSSWAGSQSASPSGGAPFPSAFMGAADNGGGTQSTLQAYLQKTGHGNSMPMYTTSTFAQTKFGSTKLKTSAKRPTRLSPTEFGNYFREKNVVMNNADVLNTQRSRSLSPRDPRVEFMIDQQTRLLHNQQQQQLQQQLQQQQQLQFQQQQGQPMNYPAQQQFYQGLQHHQQQQLQQQQLHNRLSIPADPRRMAHHNQQGVGALHDMFSGPSPLQSPGQSPGQTPGMGPSPIGSPMHSPMNSIEASPDAQKQFVEGLNVNKVPYSSQYHHLLVAN